MQHVLACVLFSFFLGYSSNFQRLWFGMRRVARIWRSFWRRGLLCPTRARPSRATTTGGEWVTAILFSFLPPNFCFLLYFAFGLRSEPRWEEVRRRGGRVSRCKKAAPQNWGIEIVIFVNCTTIVFGDLFLGFGFLVWGDMGSRVGGMHTFVGRWCAPLKASALLWNVYCRCWICLCWWKEGFSLLFGFGLGEEALLLTGYRTWLLWELYDLKPIFGWV